MTYATQQDIVDLYGQELLFVLADRDRDQVLDTAAIEKALDSASSKVDTYLSARYSVPLSEVGADLKRLVVDIAIYILALEGDAWTKEMRQRYEDALRQLELMAKGVIGLGLPPADQPPSSEIRGGAVLVSGNERIFTRTSQRGL